ncbi:hypothetical protein TNCT_361121 [Trichonephila clavata]|uniref:Uncharacterized protein n=1 Tax=Trichonephila clavata TaxID=2740835 RepID=A0A8X6IUG3_TRICU|nr:hypothetical protein TNCT_361121 [Trichonephila clavata]
MSLCPFWRPFRPTPTRLQEAYQMLKKGQNRVKTADLTFFSARRNHSLLSQEVLSNRRSLKEILVSWGRCPTGLIPPHPLYRLRTPSSIVVDLNRLPSDLQYPLD